MKKPVIRQSNDLIEASYKIASLGESRLIRLLIAQIEPSDEEFKTYKITVSDFARVFGLNDQDGRLYEMLYQASDALTSRKIRIRDEGGWLLTNWLSSAKYIAGDGFVTLKFDSELKPYLLQLKGYFTQYKLDTIVSFKSVYSIKLYELLKSEEFKANTQGRFKRNFEYVELREKLGIEKEHPLFADFRIYTIEIAKREINQHSDLLITDIEYGKTGRKVTHIMFSVARKAQCDLDLQGSSPNLEEVTLGNREIPEEVTALMGMGILEQTAIQWFKSYGEKRIARNIKYAREMLSTGKINNVSGYIKTAIASDIAKGVEAKKKTAIENKNKEALDESTKEKIQAQAKEKAIAKRELLIMEFNHLEENEQEFIRTRFESQLNSMELKLWGSAKSKNPISPEKEKTVVVNFFRYFETYQANLRLPV